MEPNVERHELFELYKLAYAEYRAEVTLGWDRQKFFLFSNPLVATLATLASGYSPHAARLGLLAVACVSLAGVLIVWRSHGRYRATREQMLVLERRLGIEGLETTGGMRQAKGKARFESFKVVSVLMATLTCLAALEIGFALYL